MKLASSRKQVTGKGTYLTEKVGAGFDPFALERFWEPLNFFFQ
jgi:hypothetical protein